MGLASAGTAAGEISERVLDVVASVVVDGVGYLYDADDPLIQVTRPSGAVSALIRTAGRLATAFTHTLANG